MPEKEAETHISGRLRLSTPEGDIDVTIILGRVHRGREILRRHLDQEEPSTISRRERYLLQHLKNLEQIGGEGSLLNLVPSSSITPNLTATLDKLSKHGITTPEQLLAVRYEDILAIDGIGLNRITLIEELKRLAQQQIDPLKPPPPVLTQEEKIHIRKTRDLRERIKASPILGLIPNKELKSGKVTRWTNLLTGNGFAQIEDLAKATDEQLGSIPNLDLKFASRLRILARSEISKREAPNLPDPS